MHINTIIKENGMNIENIDLTKVRLYGIDILQYAMAGLSSIREDDELIYKDIIYTDLRKVLLPKDTELFQKIDMKNLEYTFLPEKDYSSYNFKDVSLSNTIFTKNSVLPGSKDLFQYVRGKNISRTVLPSGDYSRYNFTGVNIVGVTTNEQSTLPNTNEFLQEIKSKSISKVKIKNGDYRNWDFSDVDIAEAYFGKDVTLPEKESLFRSTKKCSIEGCTFIEKDLSIYSFDGVDVRNCAFIKCKFPSGDWIGTIKNNSIINCKFVDCDLSECSLIGAEIKNAKFLGTTKLQKRTDLFQKVKDKNIEGVVLPKGDYTQMNFNGTNMSHLRMPIDSEMPLKYDLLKNTQSSDFVNLTRNMLKNIHLYDLSKCSINLSKYKKHLTDIQIAQLCWKYREQIKNKYIILN